MKRLGVSISALLILVALPVGASAKTLVYCAEASPDSFDPALVSSGRDASATAIYNRLVEFIPGTTRVGPGLAQSWEVSGDGLVYTFHLRPGVRFQTTANFKPTRDLNADDVIFSFDRQGNKANPYNDYGARPYDYYASMGMPTLVSRWEKVDDRTVKLTLTAPNAPMLSTLAMDFASIVSKEYADQLLAQNRRRDFSAQPVGTGPFQLVDYRLDATVRYKANADYWKGRPRIDDLVFAITTDASVRWQKLKAGECDVMPYPNPADIAAIKATPGFKVLEQPGLNVGYLAFNALQKPFDDPRVRKALAMAVDKQAIITAVFQGSGTIAKSVLPPTSWAYDSAATDVSYDPDAARRMLADAGVSNLRMKLWAMPVQRPYNPDGRRTAEIIQADFAKVGVTVDIVSYEWADYLARSRDKNRDGAMLFGFTSDNGDPDNFMAVPLGCAGVGNTNRANWCDPAFDQLLKRAAATSDTGARTALYVEAQKEVRDQEPWVVLAHSVVSIPMSSKVTGYVMDPFDHHDFAAVDIAP